MEILPIRTPLLTSGDDLAQAILAAIDLHDGDIIVFSSKVVAVTEGATIDLTKITPTSEAMNIARVHGGDPKEYQAILDETHRMNGKVIRITDRILLTELFPTGLSEGSILVPNAGLDHSNSKEGTMIGWPKDPVKSLKSIRKTLGSVAVILSDSSIAPRRSGVTAIALAVDGIDPLESQIGKPDLFGKPLRVTVEARADQLATMANAVMGNTNGSTPITVIRDHGIPFSSFSGWVPGIERERDLYHGVI
jgi:coenzyme F420-0:L-glutamate ligase